MSLDIKGEFIVGFDGEERRLLRDGVVVMEGKRVKHVGKTFSGKVAKWVDASDNLVMPGLDQHPHPRIEFSQGQELS